MYLTAALHAQSADIFLCLWSESCKRRPLPGILSCLSPKQQNMSRASIHILCTDFWKTLMRSAYTAAHTHIHILLLYSLQEKPEFAAYFAARRRHRACLAKTGQRNLSLKSGPSLAEGLASFVIQLDGMGLASSRQNLQAQTWDYKR